MVTGQRSDGYCHLNNQLASFTITQTTDVFCFLWPMSLGLCSSKKKVSGESRVMSLLAAMLQMPVITSVTNDIVLILLPPHLESTAKSEGMLQS